MITPINSYVFSPPVHFVRKYAVITDRKAKIDILKREKSKANEPYSFEFKLNIDHHSPSVPLLKDNMTHKLNKKNAHRQRIIMIVVRLLNSIPPT
jgi:hypothetical protein